MNKKLFVKLCMNYDKEPNEDLFNLWNEMLEEYHSYYVEVAINNLIKNDKFFPTFSRILEVIKELPSMEIPKEEKIKRMKEKGIIPSWLNKVIENQKLDKEAIDIQNDFNIFIEGYRNE